MQDVAQSGRAPGLGPGSRRFKSCRPDLKMLIQLNHNEMRKIVSLFGPEYDNWWYTDGLRLVQMIGRIVYFGGSTASAMASLGDNSLFDLIIIAYHWKRSQNRSGVFESISVSKT